MTLKNKLFEQVSGLSLAVFRILFGYLIVSDAWKNIRYDRAEHYFDRPFLFKYEYFEWVKLYPDLWMLELHFWMMLIFGVFIMLGLFYRVSIVAFLILFSYQFFLDQIEYLNHFYLVIVYLVVMSFLPMNARLSLDVWRSKKKEPSDVPRWAIYALMVQTEIVLIYAGLVKLNPDWLGGEPLGLWLRERWQWHIFGDLVFEDWFVLMGAWGTVFLHLLGAVLLLFRKTRLVAFCLYLLFHLMNAYTFRIGIFPFMTIGATLLFFDPDWPAKIWRKGIAFFKLPIAEKPFQIAVPKTNYRKPILIFLSVWLFFQVIIPLRPYLYPGNVAWTEEGHKFSWRMKLREKASTILTFHIKDPKSGEEWEHDIRKFVDVRTAYLIAERVNLSIQYAKYLEKQWQEKGYDDVIVTVETNVSLNGRPPQPILPKDLDLTEVKWDIWPADFLLPNCQTIPHWSERQTFTKYDQVE